MLILIEIYETMPVSGIYNQISLCGKCILYNVMQVQCHRKSRASISQGKEGNKNGQKVVN